jgi:hypothetical protein
MKLKLPINLSTALTIAVGFALSLYASAITPSWSYEHSKITKGEFQIRSACMMPAEGKLSRLSMKGREGMSKESDDWSTSLENLVEAHLKTAGVEMVPALSAESSGASGDEIRQVILQIQEKFNGIAAKINRKPKDIAKSRFTLGDEVTLLPCSAKSDVIVFVEGEGQVHTGGKKAMAALVGGAAANATLILTMADAKTGEILAFARMANAESFGEKFVDQADKVYGKALDKQLHKLRIGIYQNRR